MNKNLEELLTLLVCPSCNGTQIDLSKWRAAGKPGTDGDGREIDNKFNRKLALKIRCETCNGLGQIDIDDTFDEVVH